jgi:hypothetical protein
MSRKELIMSVGHPVPYLDPVARAAEKQASRDRDRARLAAGEVSPRELARENDFFRDFDVEHSEIVAIGRKPIGRR